jgi:hypothetical protein
VEIDLEEPTRPQLAAVFGVSSRWIGELRSKGNLPEDGASLIENIEAWAQAEYGIDGAQDSLDLDAESARLKKSRQIRRRWITRSAAGNWLPCQTCPGPLSASLPWPSPA